MPMNLPGSLAAFIAWCEQSPASTTIATRDLVAVLTPMLGERTPSAPRSSDIDLRATWRERLWVCPPDTRLGVQEAAEAFGRSRHWIYRHTAPSADARLPHKKFDGELQFLAGELRAWLRDHEETIAAGRSDTPLTLHPRRAS